MKSLVPVKLVTSHPKAVCAACLTIVLLTAVLLIAAVAARKPTVIANAGFERENGGTWTLSSSNRCRIVSDVAHSGSSSLSMTCNGEPSFASARQTLPVHGPGVLHFGVWVKLQALQGTGAYFAVTWQGSAGKRISEYYSSPIVGTLDWTKVGMTIRAPDGAKTFTIGLNVYPAPGGTVWYDDVSSEIKDEVTLRSLIRRPGYRNEVRPTQDKQITVGAEVQGSTAHPIDTLSLSVAILAKDGRLVGRAKKTGLRGDKWVNIPIELHNAAPGEYRAIVKLTVRKTGEELQRQELRLSVLGQDTPVPIVYIDNDNRCVVNGKLFFPLGFYTWGTDKEDLAQLDMVVETGFNCIVHYNIISNRGVPEATRYMDEVARRGLKIIISTKHCYDNFGTDPIRFGPWQGALPVLSGAVTTFRTHPALLGWYTDDERSDFFVPQITRAYHYIKSSDPNHIVYQVLTRDQDVSSHVGFTDVVGTDCYPVYEYYDQNQPKVKLGEVAKATNVARNATMGSRAVWQVVECSRIAPNGRCPSFEEIMCESYLAVIGGARGLFFFCLPYALRDGDSQMQALKKVGKEIQKIRPILLGIDAAPADAVVASDNRISTLTRTADDGLYVMAANPSEEGIQVTFRVGPNIPATSVEAHNPNGPPRRLIIRARKFADKIEPMGTRVYKLMSSGN